MADFKFTIPIVGKIIAYIYDFCTYKKTFNIRLLFENEKIIDGYYFWNLRIINNMSYDIKITKIYNLVIQITLIKMNSHIKISRTLLIKIPLT